MPNPSDQATVEVATLDERREALELVFRDLTPEARAEQISRLLADAEHDGAALAGLYIARRGETLRGAVLAQEQPGAAAFVWPPQLADISESALAARLLNSVVQLLERRDVSVVQALLEAEDGASAASFQTAGFAHLGNLLYLVAPCGSFPAEQPSTRLRFESYEKANHTRLLAILEQTYRETLDCPAMNGVRNLEDVLDGYRATGEFAAERWMIVSESGRDVGCLLLADHPAADQWELVYMGVSPAARGRALGLDLVRRAQWQTACAGRSRLVLAVDEANTPAIAAYDRAGFLVWERRAVYVKILAAATTDDA